VTILLSNMNNVPKPTVPPTSAPSRVWEAYYQTLQGYYKLCALFAKKQGSSPEGRHREAQGGPEEKAEEAQRPRDSPTSAPQPALKTTSQKRRERLKRALERKMAKIPVAPPQAASPSPKVKIQEARARLLELEVAKKEHSLKWADRVKNAEVSRTEQRANIATPGGVCHCEHFEFDDQARIKTCMECGATTPHVVQAGPSSKECRRHPGNSWPGCTVCPTARRTVTTYGKATTDGVSMFVSGQMVRKTARERKTRK